MDGEKEIRQTPVEKERQGFSTRFGRRKKKKKEKPNNPAEK